MSSHIESSRRFYDNQVSVMIHQYFFEYENRIAVGIAGEGSDCFGYDDFVSRDHDFGTGVCLWLTDEDMLLFGERLKEEYNKLMEQHPASRLTERLKARRGVMSIHDYYSGILGIDCDIKSAAISEDDWNNLDHTCLATAVNGEVFRDDLGVFSAYRKLLLDYYPEKIWKRRIVNELHKYSAALQVNYARCMSRVDTVAARLCHLHGLEAAMQLYFLMKRIYPPYYKWTYRKLTELDQGGLYSKWIKELAECTGDPEVWEGKTYSPNYLNMSDRVVLLSERIAEAIVKMMTEQGLTDTTDPYLEKLVYKIISSMKF